MHVSSSSFWLSIHILPDRHETSDVTCGGTAERTECQPEAACRAQLWQPMAMANGPQAVGHARDMSQQA